MHLMITRPEPDARTLMAALAGRGHQGTLEPLLQVAYAGDAIIDLEGAQALIATSRNALRALKANPVLTAARRLPLFAVGPATAAAARSLGFDLVVTGAGTAQELVTHIVAVADPAAGLLVQLRGDGQAIDLKSELEAQGFRVAQHIVYRMLPVAALSARAVESLAVGEIDGVILMSPRTAAIYASLMRKQGLVAVARGLLHACVSAAVAERLATLGSVPVAVAARPTVEEVLALVDRAAAKSRRWTG
jgi:uroporphyrinogen-III synthase